MLRDCIDTASIKLMRQKYKAIRAGLRALQEALGSLIVISRRSGCGGRAGNLIERVQIAKSKRGILYAHVKIQSETFLAVGQRRIALATPAMAQNNNGNAQETVIVTGTRVQGMTAADSAAPITVLGS